MTMNTEDKFISIRNPNSIICIIISLCQAVPLMWVVHYLSHMHRSRYNAWGQKLVLSSSFFSDEGSCQFSFSAVLDTWHMAISIHCATIAAIFTHAQY